MTKLSVVLAALLLTVGVAFGGTVKVLRQELVQEGGSTILLFWIDQDGDGTCDVAVKLEHVGEGKYSLIGAGFCTNADGNFKQLRKET